MRKKLCFSHSLLTYKISASCFLRDEIRWFRFREFCMIIVFPVYFIYTRQFLHVMQPLLILFVLSVVEKPKWYQTSDFKVTLNNFTLLSASILLGTSTAI